MKPYTKPILLRSVLYVPGSNPKTLAKAPTLDMDALILDLEDSVAPEAKQTARENVIATLQATANQDRFIRVVRINSTQTDLWQADIQALLPFRPDAIALSKTQTPDDLTGPAQLLAQTDQSIACPLWAMIESPLGVLNAFAIAQHPQVTCLVMGTSDLALALGTPYHPDRIGLRLALQQTILAAKAAEILVLDGVFVNIQDSQGFEAECHAGALLGFDGKTIIHPRQIALANHSFLPSQEETEQARLIIDSWQKARDQGEEICVVNGRLVERLHANQAKQQLAKWEWAKKRE